MARLDNLAVAVQQEPASRVYLMVYRSRRDLHGLNNRLLARMKGYLVEQRGISPERIVTVDGGEASCLTQELWVAPPGTAPPAREDAYRRDFTPTEYAREFDELHYDLPGESEYDNAADTEGSLEAFAAALLKEPRTLAYVIAYPQYYVERWDEYMGEDESSRVKRNRTHLDPPGMAEKMLRDVSAKLSREHRIPRTRIRLVDGGHRRSRQVELWIVPRGEHAPVPTPNSFPGRRRRR